MIKSSALAMGAVMIGVSAGTYYGLELLPPGLIPPPIGRVHASESAQPVARAEPARIATAPAPAQPSGEAHAEVTEQDLAEEPAPEAPAAAPTTPASDRPPNVVTTASVPVAPAQATEPVPEPVQQAPAASAPEPESESEPTETANAASAAAPTAPARATADADVIKPWWPDPAKLPANQLKLQYAGQVQGQPAIALLFTTAPKLDTLKQHASVKAANGETVTGEWSLGKNPKLAVLGGLAPGRYTVILQPEVADEKGFMLGATLTGPVYVKQP